MTNEQREAIEDLKREYEQCNYTQSDLIIELDYAKEILSLIKEQQEEIERLKTDNGNVWQLNANMSKRHLEDICKLKQKDKQIDLMADIFYKRLKAELLLEYGFESKEELKQYFERKVENER